MSISLLNSTYVKRILYVWNLKKNQLNDTVQAIEKKLLLYRKNKYHTKNMHCQMNFGQ